MTLADDSRLGSSTVEAARTIASVGDDDDDNDDEKEDEMIAAPSRRSTVLVGDLLCRDDVEPPSADVTDGVLAVVDDGAADCSDAVDDVVELSTNCWCLVVDDACCSCCCCDLTA